MNKTYKEWKKRHVNDSYEDYQREVKKEATSGVKNAIRDAYQPIYENIERQFGELPSRRKERERYLEDIYGQNLSSIGQGAEYEQGKIDVRREKQDVEKETALRDIAEDVRQSMAAGNRYLGVRGASDSSATGQMSYALQKAGMKEGSDIRQTYASNMGMLDQASTDIDFQAQAARNELSQWKTSSLMEVSTWFQDRWSALEDQKATAKAGEGQAIANLQMTMLQDTLNQINQIDMMNRQNEQYIQNWEMERKGALEDYKKKLEIESQYTPAAYTPSNVSFTPPAQAGTGGVINKTNIGGVVGTGGTSNTRNRGGTWDALKDYIFNPSGRM